MGQVEHIPAVNTVVKIEHSNIAGIHVHMVIPVAEIEMNQPVVSRVHGQFPEFIQPSVNGILQFRIGIRNQAVNIIPVVFIKEFRAPVHRFELPGQPVDHTERLAGVIEVFFKRCSLPVTVAIVTQQHSFCVGKQAEIDLLSILLNAFNHPAVNRWYHIRHRCPVPGQVVDELRFCQVILSGPVAQFRYAEYIFLFPVPAADQDTVPSARMSGEWFDFTVLQCV